MRQFRAIAGFAFLFAVVVIGPTVTPARAGAACTLRIRSDSSGAPAESATVQVGEDVFLEGTFTPNAEVTISFVRDDAFGDTQEAVSGAAEADGALALVRTFAPEDAGGWAIQASVEGDCDVSVSATVVPHGPHAPVSVRAYLCPPEIQSVADLEAAGEGTCDIGLTTITENIPDVPDGYEHNLFVKPFGWDLIAMDGTVHGFLDTELSGGGECDPATLTCAYDFSYVFPFTPVGVTQLDVLLPVGHRLGRVTFSTIGEPSQPLEFVDLGLRQGHWYEFELTEGDGVQATVFYFADPLPTPGPGGGDNLGGGSTLPDTAVSTPPAAQPIPWLLVTMAAAVPGIGARRVLVRRLHA